MSNLFNLKNDIFTIFNKMKGYMVGYTTASKSNMIIDVNEERFLITIEKIESPSKEMHEDVKKYCK